MNEDTINALESYKKTNPYYYSVYCLGEWGTLSRQIFTNYRMEAIDKDWLFSQGFALCSSCDFGYQNDPSVILLYLLDDKEKKIYVYEEFYRTGLLNNQLAEQMARMGLSKTLIYADCSELKSIEEIRQAGIRRIKPVPKGPGSVLQGIQKLQQYEIIVDVSCPHTYEELELYSWKRDRKSGEYINEPEDK